MKSLELTPLIPDGWSKMFSPESQPNWSLQIVGPNLLDVIHHARNAAQVGWESSSAN